VTTSTAIRTDGARGSSGFAPLLTAELRKLITTRMWLILIIISAAAGAAGAALFGVIVLAGGDGSALRAPEAVTMIYTGGNQFARIVAIIAGAMAMGVEYRHKTLATTYLAVPRRRWVLLGKGMITCAYGLALGLASTVLGFLVTVVFVVARDGSLLLGTSAAWRALLLNIVAIGLWAMIGYGLGVLIKNMIISIVVAVAFAYIVEPILALVFGLQEWTVLSNLMPTNATNALIGTNAGSLTGMGTVDSWPAVGAFAVLLGWALVPAVLGYLLVLRRDIE
jgi:ABC-2 type transport system permease protein